MKKILFLILLIFMESFSFEVKQEKQIKVEGGVLDIVEYKDKIIVSTEKGTVEFINIKNGKVEKKITLPKFQDFMGDYQLPKVFSVDISPNGEILAVITEATGGNRELYLERKGNLQKVISTQQRLQLTKVRFWNDNYILLSTKGSELFLYDVKNNKVIYRKQVGNYSFGDMSICDDKNNLVIGDEGGTAILVDIKSGNAYKKFDKVNVDQIYRVDCKAGKILTGGRDRRVALYDIKSGSFKKVEADFIVFSVALSSDGRYGSYQLNESNDIGIYDFQNDSLVAKLKGHKSTIGVMLFLSKDNLISGSDDGKIIVWRIKP